MSRWNQRIPRNHDELREWHEVIPAQGSGKPGVSWRITKGSVQARMFSQAIWNLETADIPSYDEAERLVRRWEKAFLNGVSQFWQLDIVQTMNNQRARSEFQPTEGASNEGNEK